MRWTVLVGLVYVCLLTALGLASMAATLPSNVLWNRTQLPMVRAELDVVAGQNFAFFTRSPESEQIVAYRLLADGTLGASLLHLPQGKAANLFGLSRTQRAQGPELANLMRTVPDAAWTNCTELEYEECVAATRGRSKVLLHNSSPIPTICGEVALTVESTVKWAYRRLSEDRYTLDRLVPANIDCSTAH